MILGVQYTLNSFWMHLLSIRDLILGQKTVNPSAALLFSFFEGKKNQAGLKYESESIQINAQNVKKNKKKTQI